MRKKFCMKTIWKCLYESTKMPTPSLSWDKGLMNSNFTGRDDTRKKKELGEKSADCGIIEAKRKKKMVDNVKHYLKVKMESRQVY